MTDRQGEGALCRWCGKTYEQHIDGGPGAPKIRCPCVGWKRNFVACDKPEPTKPTPSAAEAAKRNFVAYIEALVKGERRRAAGCRRLAMDAELEMLFALGDGE